MPGHLAGRSPRNTPFSADRIRRKEIGGVARAARMRHSRRGVRKTRSRARSFRGLSSACRMSGATRGPREAGDSRHNLSIPPAAVLLLSGLARPRTLCSASAGTARMHPGRDHTPRLLVSHLRRQQPSAQRKENRSLGYGGLLMATRKQCPNCRSESKDRSLYKCRKCGFIGCFKSGLLGSSGCWKEGACPRCDSTSSWESFGYIGEYDSN